MSQDSFSLQSNFEPSGDQPKAIREIVQHFREGAKHHTLLGVTGSGKTFTMANVIRDLNKPALVIAPNKTLAAQLYTELKGLFPENPVGYFISYYDYYQPEAYLPSSDTYIAKDSSINDDIDKMRHESTRMLFEQKKVIIVASVSCIYGLGSPSTYAKKIISLSKEDPLSRSDFIKKLLGIQYFRSDNDFKRGSFRARGDSVDVFPSHNNDECLRVEFWQGEIEHIFLMDALTGEIKKELTSVSLYPNSHYVTEENNVENIVENIKKDLKIRLNEYKKLGRFDAYERLESRITEDIESFRHLGYCPGIENYSRYLDEREAGAPPPCLLDYFPKDFITIIDESHITVPQIGGMFHGDKARKKTLVDFGFRLPSALDNRPLNFEEFLNRNNQILYVSATPGKFEMEICHGKYTEQIIRPTGLIDPPIIIKKSENQVDDLYFEICKTLKNKGRVLITTLTKKMSEDLTLHYKKMGISVTYLHSDIDALERIDILNELRTGKIDVLIGINLLREGLDLPEVKLVAIMDADKEGFLRSKTSLIQTVGRAARNAESHVIFYAEKITQSMDETIKETLRRRRIQDSYNREHGITPETITKMIPKSLKALHGFLEELDRGGDKISVLIKKYQVKSPREIKKLITKKHTEMKKVAAKLQFEKAVTLREELKELRFLEMSLLEGDNA